jgi:hypothetical protein
VENESGRNHAREAEAFIAPPEWDKNYPIIWRDLAHPEKGLEKTAHTGIMFPICGKLLISNLRIFEPICRKIGAS